MDSEKSLSKALLLVAHGSRSDKWVSFFYALQAQMIESMPDTNNVFLSFLQFSTPTFSESIEKIVLLNFKHVLLWPLFLGVGSHVKKDIPLLLSDSLTKFPHLRVDTLPALGEDCDFLHFISSYGQNFLK